MKYRKMGSLGWEVSALGFGAMRLPLIKKDKPDGVDEEQAIEMIRYAVDHGVNYIDTAWPYHGKNSETVVGRALRNGYREKIRLTTKSPLWEINTPDEFSGIFKQQLEKLQTDYVDLYLLHALNGARWKHALKMEAIERSEQFKAEGKIKHIGFSFHGSYADFIEIIDSYPWEACQIQYNYLDTDYQATLKGLEYAASKGIAVIVMEPLRGGTLTMENNEIKRILTDAESGITGTRRSLADYGLQYTWNHPGVSVVLSGMSNLRQVKENIESAEKSGIHTLTGGDLAVIEGLAAAYRNGVKVPCTFCEYCMPCPSGVSIPENLHLINNVSLNGLLDWYKFMWSYLADSEEKLKEAPNSGRATLCTECGECLDKCPQGIDIPAHLKNVAPIFEEGKKVSELYPNSR